MIINFSPDNIIEEDLTNKEFGKTKWALVKKITIRLSFVQNSPLSLSISGRIDSEKLLCKKHALFNQAVKSVNERSQVFHVEKGETLSQRDLPWIVGEVDFLRG